MAGMNSRNRGTDTQPYMAGCQFLRFDIYLSLTPFPSIRTGFCAPFELYQVYSEAILKFVNQNQLIYILLVPTPSHEGWVHFTNIFIYFCLTPSPALRTDFCALFAPFDLYQVYSETILKFVHQNQLFISCQY